MLHVVYVRPPDESEHTTSREVRLLNVYIYAHDFVSTTQKKTATKYVTMNLFIPLRYSSFCHTLIFFSQNIKKKSKMNDKTTIKRISIRYRRNP